LSGRRAERVGRQIVQALAEIVEREVSDPRIGMITFTSAHASDDLRNVRVFYSRMGSAEDIEQCAEGLTRACGFLRRETARRLSLKHAPKLRFEYDETLSRAERLDSLLAADRADLSQKKPEPEDEGEQGG
jgi:ribosome-binding factor A